MAGTARFLRRRRTQANAALSQAAAGIQPLGIEPQDTTSILKKLKKNVIIGSTVDATNGDKGPRGFSVVNAPLGKLKKNQIVVCNFADTTGAAGKGTTIEQLNSTAGSKPTRFFAEHQDSRLRRRRDQYCERRHLRGGFTSGLEVQILPSGKLKKT